MTNTPLRAFAASLCIGVLAVGCGSASEQSAASAPRTTSTTATDGVDPFCTIISEVAALLEPDPTGAESSPTETNDDFKAVASLLKRAEVAAPTGLASDIKTFAVAIDKYRAALVKVGYDLNAIYSTAEGTALANDTSHALSQAVVEHMIGPCGIKPNGGEERAP